MYRGEDLVALASHLTVGRLDAVWGSRRLSVRDIHESYRLRYQQQRRCSARSAMPAATCSASPICCSTAATSPTRCRRSARCAPPTRSTPASISPHKHANQHLLSRLLRPPRRDPRAAGAVRADLAARRSSAPSALDGAASRCSTHRLAAAVSMTTPADHSRRRPRLPARRVDAEAAGPRGRPADARSPRRPLRAVRRAHRRRRASRRSPRDVAAWGRGARQRVGGRAGEPDRHAGCDPARGAGRSGDACRDDVWITWADQVGVLPDTVAAAGRRHVATRRRRRWRCRPCGAAIPTSTSSATRPGGSPAAAAARRGRDAGRRARATWGCSRCRARRSSAISQDYAREVAARHRHRRAQLSCPFMPWLAQREHGRDVPVHRSDGSDRHQHAGRAAAGRSVARRTARMKIAVGRHPRLQRRALHRHAARADQGGRSGAARLQHGDHRRRRLLEGPDRRRSWRRSPGVRLIRQPSRTAARDAPCAPASPRRPAIC